MISFYAWVLFGKVQATGETPERAEENWIRTAGEDGRGLGGVVRMVGVETKAVSSVQDEIARICALAVEITISGKADIRFEHRPSTRVFALTDGKGDAGGLDAFIYLERPGAVARLRFLREQLERVSRGEAFVSAERRREAV